MITLVADLTTMQVGCVLIQSAAGCDPRLVYELGFNTESWVLFPAKTQKRITGTEEQWKKFASECNSKHIRNYIEGSIHA